MIIRNLLAIFLWYLTAGMQAWALGNPEKVNDQNSFAKMRIEAGKSQSNQGLSLQPKNTIKPWGIVSLSVANLRITPSHDAELVTQLIMGTPVKVLKEKDDWSLVQTPENYVAWCENDAFTAMKEEEMSLWRKSPRVFITILATFMLDSLNNQSVCDLVAGCVLQRTSQSGSDVFVKTPDGRKGRLNASDVTDFDTWRDTVQLRSNSLIATARKLTGIPYLWGGTSIKAMDCSGFTKTVYFLNGCILARDASQQAMYGKHLEVNQGWKVFQPGDLLYFGSPATKSHAAKITHTALYLGDSEFIHASGRVRINSLDPKHKDYSEYRTISLLAARRIVGLEKPEGITYIKNHPWY